MFTGATIYDVTPTLLHLLGLPIAEDMKGSPVAIARPGSALDRKPVYVRSYGPAARPVADQASDDTGDQLRYLRALGYVP